MKRSKTIKASVVLTIVGLVITIYCNRGYLKAKASASWPSTKGQIISSELNRSMIRRGGSARTRGFYIFKARYQYEISGEVYDSQRVSFLSKYILMTKKRPDIKSIYAAGRTVDVFYNPDVPGESTLITGVNKYNRSPHHLTGLTILVIGAIVLTIEGLLYLWKGND